MPTYYVEGDFKKYITNKIEVEMSFSQILLKIFPLLICC